METNKETVYIDAWSSSCGNCGKSADPKEKGHFTLLGYGPDNGKPGCGVIWKYIASSSWGVDDGILRDMRPDLEVFHDSIRFAFTAPEMIKEIK